MKVHKVRNENHIIVLFKTEIVNAVQKIYVKLYAFATPRPKHRRPNILNVGLEEITEINLEEFRLALMQMNNRKSPGGDRLTSVMLKTGSEFLIKLNVILLNKFLEEGKIPVAWNNAHVILLF